MIEIFVMSYLWDHRKLKKQKNKKQTKKNPKQKHQNSKPPLPLTTNQNKVPENSYQNSHTFLDEALFT